VEIQRGLTTIEVAVSFPSDSHTVAGECLFDLVEQGVMGNRHPGVGPVGRWRRFDLFAAPQ